MSDTNWIAIAGTLLSSGTPVAAVAGALEQTMIFINRMTADNPEKQLLMRRAYIKGIQDYSLKAKEAKDVKALNKIIIDIISLGESK